jgi:hypothetical protein
MEEGSRKVDMVISGQRHARTSHAWPDIANRRCQEAFTGRRGDHGSYRGRKGGYPHSYPGCGGGGCRPRYGSRYDGWSRSGEREDNQAPPWGCCEGREGSGKEAEWGE